KKFKLMAKNIYLNSH
ncbi:Acetate CoA-transferase subunit alpha, partial [Haemophilus influenzae]